MYKDQRIQEATRLRDCLRMPLFWISISFFDYAIFAWATSYVDTAVAATIFELWPIVFIAVLIRLPAIIPTRAQQRNPSALASRKKISGHHWTLILAAPLGLALVFVSRTEGFSATASDYFDESIFGICLAVVSALLAGIPPALTIFYGDMLCIKNGRNLHLDDTDGQPVLRPGDDPDVKDQRLWYTVFTFGISLFVSIFYNALVGTFISQDGPAVTPRLLVGGVILGAVLLAPASILLRKANHDTEDPAINGIFLGSPALALVLLAAFGILLPRFDIFAMGATLILIINILIQVDPDEESDLERLGEEPLSGTRLGFTALILALWTFGTIIYLRDEVLPDDWLIWSGFDYWGLLALSATVFALIFGFRVARLTTRINREDELTINIFRKSEDLTHRTDRAHFDPEILTELRRLDRASPKLKSDRNEPTRQVGVSPAQQTTRATGESMTGHETRGSQPHSQLFDSYLSLRQKLAVAKRYYSRAASHDSNAREVSKKLAEIEVDLDLVTHSKQQGRDMSELMSLVIFATITVLLGVSARPSSVTLETGSWSGFLTELFSMLFVSTISFLAVNLFDIRRARETPLFVRISRVSPDQVDDSESEVAQETGDRLSSNNLAQNEGALEPASQSPEEPTAKHLLFFRHKRNLAFQRLIAVAITGGVCIIYAALLYSKWL